MTSEIQNYLFGRALLRAELPFSSQTLAEHIANGSVCKMPGITNGVCMRCGNRDYRFFGEYPCYKCKKQCCYCRYCIMLGKNSECSQLFIWTGADVTWSKSFCTGTFNLSKTQKEASEKIAEVANTKEEITLWAVATAS